MAAPSSEPIHALAHAGSAEALLRTLKTDAARGLSIADAEQRLATQGANELPTPPPPSPLKQFLAQFTNPIVLTLIGAAVIAIVNGASQSELTWLERYGDAIAIILIIVINAVLGLYQERRAEAALDALKKMQSPNARVRRDDQVSVVAARTLVVGDIVELEAGDAIPADARLLQTIDFSVQEASLTGESVPISKDARATVAQDAPLGDRTNMLFVGTAVVRGKGRAVVVATGPNTELGKLSALMSAPTDSKTPLEERLDHFGKRILWACLAISGILFAHGMATGRAHWHQLLLEAVSLAVAAIPEGLPAITTITLALGMQRMAKNGAIIRKLAAVETLGAATVICSDKTGTLTQNEMTVREVYAGGVTYKVTGTGYNPDGDLVDDNGATVAEPEGALRYLLATVALANNAKLEQNEAGDFRVVGDPTEGALLTLAAKAGTPRESIAPSLEVVTEIPFDSDRKRMTIVTLDKNGREIAHTKGSADVLLPLATHHYTYYGKEALTDEARAEILRVAEEMSSRALRVLAVARRELQRQPNTIPPMATTLGSGEIEQRLTFLGLVAMIDPPRVGVKEAVKECGEAGVRVVMITGDHKLTAIAIAKELGVWSDGATAFTGADVEKLSDDELGAAVDNARVFARVTAEQKLRIVRAFKSRDHVVAMTGDGVNDAPALREAHIGIAMGKDGTDVAREAADMVLADDNFATIVLAVREGRSIYRNIQKFIFFLLSSNAGLVFAVFIGALLPHLPALRPLMILWINLVTNGLPALALGIDPPDPTQMTEPPRRKSEGLLGAREYFGIAVVGVLMCALALLCAFWQWPSAASFSNDEKSNFARAIAFSLLALCPLFHAFNCRSATASLFSSRPLISIPLLLSVVVSAAIHLVSVLVPSLRSVFFTYALSASEWGLLLLLSFSIIPMIEMMKFGQRRFLRLG